MVFSYLYDFGVSACEDGGEVTLYLTTLVPTKPFVLGPFLTNARRTAFMQVVGELLILVDVDYDPSYLSREGGVLIYSINHNLDEPEIFDEIDFIDTDDLSVAAGWNHD